MAKKSFDSNKEPESSLDTISKNQHLALNNLNMIMYWIRKKTLNEDQLLSVLSWTDEALREIKKV